MAYGSVLTDVVQSSTAGTPPQFNDGSGVQTGTLCRAWVNFNGVTTATVRASFNVSSVTRNATGDYTVNFTTALPDANYAGIAMAGNGSTTAVNLAAFGPMGSGATGSAVPTTTTFRFIVTNISVGLVDAAYINFAAFR